MEADARVVREGTGGIVIDLLPFETLVEGSCLRLPGSGLEVQVRIATSCGSRHDRLHEIDREAMSAEVGPDPEPLDLTGSKVRLDDRPKPDASREVAVLACHEERPAGRVEVALVQVVCPAHVRAVPTVELVERAADDRLGSR